MAPPKPHVLVISMPEQSHLNPLLQLSTKLASRGLKISFVVSHSTLASAKQSHDIVSTELDLKLIEVPDDLPPHSNPGSHVNAFLAVKNMFRGVELLLESLASPQQELPVTFLLSDIFATWSQHLSCKFGIPNIVFFTSNAVACSIGYHASSLHDQGILPFQDEDGNFIVQDPVTCIPGVPPLLPADFPGFMTCPASHPLFQVGIDTSHHLQTASGIIINTFEEMDSTAIAALAKEIPVYAIGPLPLLCTEQGSLSMNYWQQQDDCLGWLNKQPNGSVIYVSFGSASSGSSSLLEQVALGLEASMQPFVWSIRPDCINTTTISEMLPEGFVGRTKDRGLIISWAPQLAVLGHSAVGGFVTHCGWNSILENVSVGAVPMVCIPLRGEQKLNCVLVEKQWKIGMGLHGEEVLKEEVAKAVKTVMEGEIAQEMREFAAQLKEKARSATQVGGSSLHNFEALIKALS